MRKTATAIEQVVILGHSGFIGTCLEKKLRKNSSWSVIGCSLPEIDFSDAGSAHDLQQYLSPGTCLILAAAAKRQFGDSLDSFRHNTSIVENVCNLIQKQAIAKLFYFSSAAVYGEETHNTNISESTPVNPTSFYGINKFASERLLWKICNQAEVPLVCLRPPLIYGPGDPARTYGPSAFSAAAQAGEGITLWGDGSELREFIFIDDLCRIIEFLVTSEFTGALNIVSGDRCCFADIIEELRARYPELQVSTRERSKTKADNAFDPALIRSILPADFQFTSLGEGLQRILASNANP